MDPIDEAQKIDNGWEWDCLVAERDALLARVAELEAENARLKAAMDRYSEDEILNPNK